MNVVALAPVAAQIRANRKEDLLQQLDALRERICSGEVTEVAYVAVCADGGASTMVGPTDNCFVMLGAMERLKLRFHKKHLDTEE